MGGLTRCLHSTWQTNLEAKRLAPVEHHRCLLRRFQLGREAMEFGIGNIEEQNKNFEFYFTYDPAAIF
jgi:hypothetical protein